MMDTQEFERIKKKIEIGKEKDAKARGIIENILSSAKNQYDLNSIEEVQEQLDTCKAERDANLKRMDAWYEELLGLTNWALL
jgi:hypothetical protein